MKHYFTFGQLHTHPETGEPLKDHWVEIDVEDMFEDINHGKSALLQSYDLAKEVMDIHFGERWSMHYTREPEIEFYPKGCYKTIKV